MTTGRSLRTVEGFGHALGAVHGFTTRWGGDAPPPWDTLPLARAEGLEDAWVVNSWQRVLSQLDPRLHLGDLALVRQVHGIEVLRVAAGTGPLDEAGVADALVTTVPGLALGVRVADCVPVLFAAPGGVAVAHAGWRGLVGGVVPATVRALLAATGARPAQVQVAVGPHLGAAAFEVGPEVVEAVVAAGLPADRLVRQGLGDRAFVDLGGAVEVQVRALGVDWVGHLGDCTSSATYYSWRRDRGVTGRQAGVIAWWP